MCDVIGVEVLFDVITFADVDGEITAVELVSLETVYCSPSDIELEVENITVVEVLEFFSLEIVVPVVTIFVKFIVENVGEFRVVELTSTSIDVELVVVGGIVVFVDFGIVISIVEVTRGGGIGGGGGRGGGIGIVISIVEVTRGGAGDSR